MMRKRDRGPFLMPLLYTLGVLLFIWIMLNAYFVHSKEPEKPEKLGLARNINIAGWWLAEHQPLRIVKDGKCPTLEVTTTEAAFEIRCKEE